jgi:hypothetical protein
MGLFLLLHAGQARAVVIVVILGPDRAEDGVLESAKDDALNSGSS